MWEYSPPIPREAAAFSATPPPSTCPPACLPHPAPEAAAAQPGRGPPVIIGQAAPAGIAERHRTDTKQPQTAEAEGKIFNSLLNTAELPPDHRRPATPGRPSPRRPGNHRQHHHPRRRPSLLASPAPRKASIRQQTTEPPGTQPGRRLIGVLTPVFTRFLSSDLISFV